MKVFLYIRVACADQLAAADQREELERYAKDKGYEVAAAVAADGISGVHTEGIMNFLLNEAKRQDIGTILTRDTSRISRDTSSFMRFERKFRENGIRFEYLSKPDNELPVTPMMEAFEAAYKKRRTKNIEKSQAVHGWLSTYERLVNSQNFFSPYLTQEDLSRLGREYIETGRYLRRVFPAYGVRFIAITDSIDTAHDSGDDLTASVKNIMNEAYCRDISIKTRSSLDVKRRNGDFVGAFPVYGYMKAEDNKNLLVPDPYAARVVCDIFRMRLEGASASKIASELNRLGILSPLAYKKNNGLPYAKKGYADKADCKWSATTIIRILQDETYTGTLVQGKQGTPHYKIKQMEQRPASEWVRVPDAHEALIARQDFELVQRIKGLDTRTSPNEDTVYLFSGILICGCCGSRMTRKTNRANGKEYHYYYCPTGKKKGCAHPVMLKESSLIDCVRDSLKAYIGNIASLEALLSGIDQSSINQALAKEYSDHITDNERRLEQVLEFKARLYESLVGGMLTKEEYASYKAKYTKQAEDIRESVRVLREKLTEVLENRSERNRWISQFTQFSTLETLDRRALIHMVQSIRVRGKKELDITFTHEDEYKKALQLLALAAQQKDYEQRKVG